VKTKLSRVSLLCGLALSFSAGSAQALSITLALVVTTAEPVEVGESFDVDVQIAGLGADALPSLRSYNLTIGFDGTKIDFTGLVHSSELTPGLTGGPTEGVGTVQFTQISTETDLTFQPDGFTLATLTFTALVAGDWNLNFQPLVAGSLANQSGASLTPDVTSLTGDTVTVPEPGLLGLLALGLAAGARQLRRRR
jgi:MYXO-CTERM domain-containing protein